MLRGKIRVKEGARKYAFGVDHLIAQGSLRMELREGRDRAKRKDRERRFSSTISHHIYIMVALTLCTCILVFGV